MASNNFPQGRRKQDLEKQAAPLFATITCEPIMASAADHYATVKITMRRKGLALDENDLWIAATALAMGAALITRDNDVNRSKVFQYRTGRHNLSRSKKAQTDPFNRTSLRIRPVIKLSTTITTMPIPSIPVQCSGHFRLLATLVEAATFSAAATATRRENNSRLNDETSGCVCLALPARGARPAHQCTEGNSKGA
jgi:hypothetical protein